MIPIILANTLLYTVCLLMVAYKPWRKVQNILTNQPNLAVKRIEEWVRESHYAIAETFPQKLGHGCGGGVAFTFGGIFCSRCHFPWRPELAEENFDQLVSEKIRNSHCPCLHLVFHHLPRLQRENHPYMPCKHPKLHDECPIKKSSKCCHIYQTGRTISQNNKIEFTS